MALGSQRHGESDEGREAMSSLVGKAKVQILGDALLRDQGREGASEAEAEASEGARSEGTLRPGPPGQDTQSEDEREDVPAERILFVLRKPAFQDSFYQLKGKVQFTHNTCLCAY